MITRHYYGVTSSDRGTLVIQANQKGQLHIYRSQDRAKKEALRGEVVMRMEVRVKKDK